MSEITAQPHISPTTQFRLTASDLEIWRGETLLLQQFSFQLFAGELLWLRGPNGAGKTSLMRTLAGLAWPESGRVEWWEKDQPLSRDAFLADLAWCAHQPGLRGELSPRENLAAWLPLTARSSRMSIDQALTRVGLQRHRDQLCHKLSAGQLRRAALARLLLTDARLWLLDEPLTSLDGEGQTLVGELLAEHCAHGGAAMVSSHQPLPGNTGPVRELSIGGGGGA